MFGSIRQHALSGARVMGKITSNSFSSSSSSFSSSISIKLMMLDQQLRSFSALKNSVTCAPPISASAPSEASVILAASSSGSSKPRKSSSSRASSSKRKSSSSSSKSIPLPSSSSASASSSSSKLSYAEKRRRGKEKRLARLEKEKKERAVKREAARLRIAARKERHKEKARERNQKRRTRLRELRSNRRARALKERTIKRLKSKTQAKLRPHRVASPYILFVKENSKEIYSSLKSSNPQATSKEIISKIGRIIGDKWKQLSDLDRQRFEDEHQRLQKMEEKRRETLVKKPTGAYGLFIRDFFSKKQFSQNDLPFAAKAKEAANAFRALPEAEKAKYQAASDKNKLEYQEQRAKQAAQINKQVDELLKPHSK